MVLQLELRSILIIGLNLLPNVNRALDGYKIQLIVVQIYYNGSSSVLDKLMYISINRYHLGTFFNNGFCYSKRILYPCVKPLALLGFSWSFE
jgi:hypothetical protein